MRAFDNIIGHGDVKSYFLKTLQKNKLSHSYLFEGLAGVGKNTFALELAQLILCEASQEDKPCQSCKACHMIHAKTHPDVIVINKDTQVTKIETIRTQMVKEMGIKPYQSEHKIIIVKAADSITVEGQNAMLKTIEDPPQYGLIILVCENASKLLPTIKSRCINIRFNALNQQELSYYLDKQPIEGIQKQVVAKLADGSIGVIQDILKDSSYWELRAQSIEYLSRLQKADLISLYDIVKEIADQKEGIGHILNFWLLWYRDIAVLKKTQSIDLYYIDHQKLLLDMASKLTYNKISDNIDHIKTALLDFKQNIYPTFIIENLLLQLKERKK